MFNNPNPTGIASLNPEQDPYYWIGKGHTFASDAYAMKDGEDPGTAKYADGGDVELLPADRGFGGETMGPIYDNPFRANPVRVEQSLSSTGRPTDIGGYMDYLNQQFAGPSPIYTPHVGGKVATTGGGGGGAGGGGMGWEPGEPIDTGPVKPPIDTGVWGGTGTTTTPTTPTNATEEDKVKAATGPGTTPDEALWHALQPTTQPPTQPLPPPADRKGTVDVEAVDEKQPIWADYNPEHDAYMNQLMNDLRNNTGDTSFLNDDFFKSLDYSPSRDDALAAALGQSKDYVGTDTSNPYTPYIDEMIAGTKSTGDNDVFTSFLDNPNDARNPDNYGWEDKSTFPSEVQRPWTDFITPDKEQQAIDKLNAFQLPGSKETGNLAFAKALAKDVSTLSSPLSALVAGVKSLVKGTPFLENPMAAKEESKYISDEVANVKALQNELAQNPDEVMALLRRGGVDTSAADLGTMDQVYQYVPENWGDYYGDSSYCTDPDTLVTLADGSEIRVADLKIGTMVRGYDEKTKEFGAYPITAYKRAVQPKVIVSFDNGKKDYICSTSHRVLVGDEFVQITSLCPGILLGGDVIKAITPTLTGEVIMITVDTVHTYLTEGIISHNVKMTMNNSYAGVDPESEDYGDYWEARSGGQVPRYAMGGGINQGLGATYEYAAGGKLLRGPGDGMSDSIKANIAGNQEARLADGEFVIPADVVSGLGNGSTEAGSRKLYEMMDRIRMARTGTKKQGKKINPDKFFPE